MANSADSGQNIPLGPILTWSVLFVWTYMSINLVKNSSALNYTPRVGFYPPLPLADFPAAFLDTPLESLIPESSLS